MKKSILFLLAICIVIGNPLDAQINRLLNKVTKSVTADKKPVGNSQSENVSKEPEPKSACDNPEMVVDLGGKLKLMYSEINISISDDGSILLKDRTSSDYYIVKNGTPEGPVKVGDPRLAAFENVKEDNSNSTPTWANNEFITKAAEKYTITFGGKKYGPFSEIHQFKVSTSKDKFAAVVVQNVAYSQDRVKKMEEAMKNAKTDQEKMDLSMQFSQEMAQNMQKAGGIEGTLPKLITNIQSATWDPKQAQGSLNSGIKYDDILISSYDKIIDLTGKVLITIKPEAGASEKLFVNSPNTKYAYYNYGTLTFGDGTSLPDLFNAHLVKSNGATSIAYMYYSPKTNAIMQCKIPF
jgi:hypothetical protein